MDGAGPKLPTGQQMAQMGLPAAVQEQICIIALQLLQRLFGPLVRRHRLRKARLALQHLYVSKHSSPAEVEAAVVSALQHVSFFGAITRDAMSAGPTAAVGDGAARSPVFRADGLPPGASLTGSVSVTAADPAGLVELREQVRVAIAAGLARLVVYLQDEVIEWEWEPASEVLVLVAGAVERRGSAVAVARTMSANPSTGGGSVPGTRRPSAAGSHNAASRTASISYGRPGGSRRGSAAGAGAAAPPNASLSATTRSVPRRPSAGDGRAFTSSGAGPVGGPATNDIDTQLLAAPQVLGELACLGAFPYCATLCVTSPTAVVMRLPKEVYGKLISECVPVEGQRRLMVEALQMRERLLPFYAPLSSARLLLCPLLTHLRPEQLEHIRDLAVPRVYAAGMECGERDNPRHIFFIRRGVVQMQREGGALGSGAVAGDTAASEVSTQQTSAGALRASFSLSLPKNRPVLVEGHTFGETGCIFGDALGDRYTAVTHVDMYLLPFQVLIQLMKQVPEVQSSVYRSAQELSYLRDKEWLGVTFGPSVFGVELPNVHGIVPAQSLLASMATTQGAPRPDWQHTNAGNRARRSLSDGHDPLGSHGASHGGAGGGGVTRRVTIFEDSSTVGGTADRTGTGGGSGHGEDGTVSGLTGGRVSSALLTAMEQLPVVSLLPNFNADFAKACTAQWQCVTYAKNDVIAAAGQECNRLLLFFEGRAGVVHNPSQMREELHPGPFGVADLNSMGPDVVCRIPAGHVVGYTCVRRHRWSLTIVALDDVVEVWELRRPAFVHLLRTHGMERDMQTAALQLLQPLAVQKDRLAVLDYQPLLHPMPNSLWKEQGVPNVHPVVAVKEGAACFPVWREGDFPLDRRASVVDTSGRSGSAGGRRGTLTAVGSVRGAAIANERQRSGGQRVGDSPKLTSQRSGSVAALSDSESGARTNFIARLASAA